LAFIKIDIIRGKRPVITDSKKSVWGKGFEPLESKLYCNWIEMQATKKYKN
jgi:hypothetical protein